MFQGKGLDFIFELHIIAALLRERGSGRTPHTSELRCLKIEYDEDTSVQPGVSSIQNTNQTRVTLRCHSSPGNLSMMHHVRDASKLQKKNYSFSFALSNVVVLRM